MSDRNHPSLGTPELWHIGRDAAIGVVVGSAAGWLLVPLDPPQAVTIVVILLAVLTTAWWLGRVAGSFCAVSAGLWFGYAHTHPRFETVISRPRDVYLTLGLIVAGLLAAEAVHWWKQQREGPGGTGPDVSPTSRPAPR